MGSRVSPLASLRVSQIIIAGPTCQWIPPPPPHPLSSLLCCYLSLSLPWEAGGRSSACARTAAGEKGAVRRWRAKLAERRQSAAGANLHSGGARLLELVAIVVIVFGGGEEAGGEAGAAHGEDAVEILLRFVFISVALLRFVFILSLVFVLLAIVHVFYFL